MLGRKLKTLQREVACLQYFTYTVAGSGKIWQRKEAVHMDGAACGGWGFGVGIAIVVVIILLLIAMGIVF